MKMIKVLVFSLLFAATMLGTFAYGWSVAYSRAVISTNNKMVSSLLSTCVRGKYIFIGDKQFRCLVVQKT